MSQRKKRIFAGMFVRKKKNKSGLVSVQVIDKSRKKYKVLKTIGSSCDDLEIEQMYQQGKKWIAVQCGAVDMFDILEREREEKHVTEYLLNNIENILLNGTQSINYLPRTSGKGYMLKHSKNHILLNICMLQI